MRLQNQDFNETSYYKVFWLCSTSVVFTSRDFFKYEFTLQKHLLPFLSNPHLSSDAHSLAILILFCQTQHVCKTLSDNTHIWKLITEGRLNIVVGFFLPILENMPLLY